MIFVTGDVHCPIDISKLNSKNFRKQRELTKNDNLIVCGDMGLVWSNPGNKGYNEDVYWQKWFNTRNYTTLFIDGNHENHPVLNSYPIVNIYGGRAHQIKETVFHLMRGEIYTINGRTFYCFGGAASHDKHLRKEGVDWWPEEEATYDEMCHGVENLEKHKYNVDYIISHDGPKQVVESMVGWGVEPNTTNKYLDFLSKNARFKGWYFGHHHDDIDLGLYHMLYDRVIELD